MAKFAAELNGDASGHIIIDNENFTWRPLTLTKILSFGQAKEFSIPVKFIEGYQISTKLHWKFLHIAVAGEDTMIGFNCLKPHLIVEELKKYNPYVRMME
ncbi:MAG: hypothetical protein K2O78_08075 [Muribaculaceae bacterium]|nr:hypothetical protein [Muribaculaceae bacterium]